MAAASAAKEALWMRTLLQDLGAGTATDHMGGTMCITIQGDNQGAISLLRNPVSFSRAKHIDIHHHFVRERVARGEIKFTYIPTLTMMADGLTKPVPHSKFDACRAAMGVH
jgi:hypothetical protein